VRRRPVLDLLSVDELAAMRLEESEASRMRHAREERFLPHPRCRCTGVQVRNVREAKG